MVQEEAAEEFSKPTLISLTDFFALRKKKKSSVVALSVSRLFVLQNHS
jgi:hypothetical protein